MGTSVNKISHEQVVCVGTLSTNFEKLFQVVELTMDITTDGHRGGYWLNVGFFLQNFFRLKK